ncbi:MAG: HTH domain-containing protein [Candidatus Lokiarchaeota archaeon]|nr:HTH domain-containing protein [Candidatus Lokiarchaeota archaeon]
MKSLEDLESVVFSIVKEYLTKKTFFSINDIIEFVSNRVRLNPNINRNKIELIIKSLIKKRVIIPGTRLMKNNIIENPTRNEIFNYINRKPSNINEIMRVLKIGSNQALWHLSCLEKFQFVRSEKLNNHRIFFKFDSNPKFDKFHYYLNKDLVQTIITFMKEENKAFKITEIADGLKKNHSTVKKYLDILKNLKLIKIEKVNGRNGFKLDLEQYSKVLKSIQGE